MNNPEIRKLKCVGCGNEFDATERELFGHRIIINRLCNACSDKRVEKQEQEKIEAIQAQENMRRMKWLRDCGIPLRYTAKTFSNFLDRGGNTKRVLEVCEDYIANFPLMRNNNYKSICLFSQGIWGIGKTHLACAMASSLMERWLKANNIEVCPLLYTTESNMFLRIRATFNQHTGETENDIYKKLTKIPLLIIDDVGKEEVNDSKFVQRVWFAIINGRYDNLLPVIITANLDPDGLAHHLGGSRNNEATWDRLLEMFDGEIWQLEAPSSYRREKYNGLPDK